MTLPLEWRFSNKEDEPILVDWLLDHDVLCWFPMFTPMEVRQAVHMWIMNAQRKAAWTCLYEGKPAGMMCIELSPYSKCAHQSLMTIIVRKDLRGRGIGSQMIRQLKIYAKELGITLLHLEVYDGNPAKKLYEREGFKEYGVHPAFLREKGGGFSDKIMMQLRLST